MFTEEDWLDQFIKDYKSKLALEKLELLASHQRSTARSQQKSPHVGTQQPGDAISFPSKPQLTFKVTSSVKEQLNPDVTDTGVTEYPDLASVVGRDEQRDAIERKKKQEEYHRILDQQLAENRQRKQEELMKKKLPEADDIENTSNPDTGRSSVHPRSPSPPIKSCYRNYRQVRVPSRPLTANGNQQRLSDLTELRQLYSNR